MTDSNTADDIALSATIILIRECPDMQVLMVQRSTKMGFAGGAIVFPGGKVDKADYSVDYASADPVHAYRENELVTRVAAIRELFEETGVLLALKSGALITEHDIAAFASPLSGVRDAVYQDAAMFDEFLASEQLTPAIDALTLFAQWRTPPAIHRRFDTWFYVAQMPTGQDVIPDGNESTEALWATPKSFLDLGESGERKVIFPTARNLELLDLNSTYDALLKNTKSRSIECIEPIVVDRSGNKFLTIPDGFGYPVLEEELETAKRT